MTKKEKKRKNDEEYIKGQAGVEEQTKEEEKGKDGEEDDV